MATPVILGRQRSDRRAADTEQRLFADLPMSPTGTRPAQDPTSAQGRASLGFHRGGQLVVGRIVDLIAYARTYKVQCERGLGTVRACDSGHTGFGVVGPRQLNTYPVGTAVLLLHHPQSLYAIILCALPDWAFDARHAIGDMVVQGSNVGVQCDAVHNQPFGLQGGGGIIDFSAGRPGDSLSNDWGAITETGLRIFLDSFHAQVAVDEETGLFVFYDDQLTRLSGHNLQLRSAVFDREDLDDESELSSVEGYAPYWWEVLGLFGYNGVPQVELDAATTQQNDTNRSRFEPVYDDQLGLYRERRFHGYLGQGGRRSVSVPVGSGVNRYSTAGTRQLGVAEETWGLDGAIGLRSMHSIVLAKTPLIAEPQQRRRPENPAGDNTATNYKSCGLFGTGPAHSVGGQPANGNTLPHVVEAATLLDQVTYAFNWKGLHPFHYHALDWYLPDEKDLPQYSTVASSVVPFADLGVNNALLPAASAIAVEVDDRYGAVAYYANTAHIALLPGGGIAIVDGWGSEIRMVAGQIHEHAAADLIKTCGRNAFTMAGWDVVQRANNCVEQVANLGDVRIKAQNRVMVTGGNNGCGGILLESRGTGAAFQQDLDGEDVLSGILLKAKDSAVAVASKLIELNTSYYGEGAGRIHLDAGGSGTLIERAAQIRRHVTTAALDFIGGTCHEFWENQTVFGNAVLVEGEAVFADKVGVVGDMVSWGDVYSAGYYDVTSSAPTIPTRNTTDVRNTSLTQLFWLSNETDIELLEFYFRNTTLAAAVGFGIHEPTWHQLARGTGISLPRWEEQAVNCEFGRNETAAFPGYQAWFTGTAYGLVPLTLYDINGHAANDRGSIYETPSLGSVTFVNLEGYWPVVRNPA